MLILRATRNNQLSLLLTAILLLAIGDLFAQRPIFQSLNVDVETEQVRIQAVAQDHNNYLYFGTDKGLVKYNGIESIPIRTEDSIFIKSITALHMSSDRSLWIGGSEGELNILRKNQIKKFRNSFFEPSSKITDIYEDEEGVIWIATYGDGVYRIDYDVVENFRTENGLSDNYTYTIYEDPDHLIWIGTDAGISRYNSEDKSFSYISTKNGLPDNIVRVIIGADQDEKVWIAMQDSGICKYNMASAKFQPLLSGGITWDHGAIGSMIKDVDGNLWAGTLRKGVVKVTLGDNIINKRAGKKYDLRVYSATNGISSDEILTLFEDDEHNIWMGTRLGASVYTRSPFEYLTVEDGLSSNSVYALLVDADDNYWICTENEVIKYTYLPSGKVSTKSYLSSSGKLNKQVVSIYEDANRNIWMGTYGDGVYMLNPRTDKITLYSTNNGLVNNNVMSITEDEFGNIWLATLGGVSKISLEGIGYSAFEITNYTQADGLGSNYVYHAYRDHKGYLWFATDGGGISKHNRTEFVPVVFPKSLKSNTNYSITGDKIGGLWFGNSEGGIYNYSGHSLVNYNNKNELRDNSPIILTTGINDEIIVAHGKGIDILYKGEKSFKAFDTDWEQFDFNPSLNACYTDSAGHVWIGTSSGIVKFRYVDDPHVRKSPIVILNNIRVMEQNVATTELRAYEYDENQFSFEFLGVWLKSPESVTYRYKLEGYEENWSRVTTERYMSYANLPPGEYIFKVKSQAKGSSWNDVPVEYSFIIHSPFWQTWWFYVICIISIWSLAYLAYIQRMKYLQASNIILRRKVKDAEEEVDRLKREKQDANETYA